MTAPVAKDRSDPSPGAPSPDHPVRGPPGLCTEVRRPRVCGTPRMTNLFLRSSKPSRFSRISPNSRISAGFSKFSFKSGLNSATNRGLSFGSVAMNAGSMVKLFSAGWQVPQVRPLPANVSLKNRSLPLAMSWLKRSAGGEAGLHVLELHRSVMAAVHRPCQMRLSRPAGFKPPTTRIFSAPTSAHAVRWGARRLTRVSCTGPSCSTWRTQQSNTLPRVQSQRLGEAPVGLQGVAVLAVAGGVLGARQEQPIAVGGPGVEKVLQ